MNENFAQIDGVLDIQQFLLSCLVESQKYTIDRHQIVYVAVTVLSKMLDLIYQSYIHRLTYFLILVTGTY